MEKKEENYSYLNMIVGTAGMILLVLGIFEQIFGQESVMGLPLMFIGFSFMIHYIYALEKESGVSNKLIWTRAIILILMVLGFNVVYQ